VVFSRVSVFLLGKREKLILALVALWLSLGVAGFCLILAYEARGSAADSTPLNWPDGTQIPKNIDGATLLMFVHPNCPCTSASLGELEKLMARHQDDVRAFVIFSKPVGADESWDRTDLFKTAESIPGVQILQDVGNEDARRFHATTSGQTLLYDRNGHLAFSGGITLARGHSGDNPGCDAIESFLSQGFTERDRTPVFGCAITPAAVQQ
jgi:hypothetical protein